MTYIDIRETSKKKKKNSLKIAKWFQTESFSVDSQNDWVNIYEHNERSMGRDQAS